MLDYITAEEISDRFNALYHCMTDFATTDTGKPYVIFRCGDDGVGLCEDNGVVYMQTISKKDGYMNISPRQQVNFKCIEEAYSYFMKSLVDGSDTFDEKWVRTACANTIYMMAMYREFDDYTILLKSVAPFLRDCELLDVRNIWGKLLKTTHVVSRDIYLILTYINDRYECIFFDKDFKAYKKIPVFNEEELMESIKRGFL